MEPQMQGAVVTQLGAMMGYASAAVTAGYLKMAQQFNDDRLIEQANAIVKATNEYNAKVFRNWVEGNLSKADYEQAKAEYVAEVKALLGELRSIE